MARHVPSPFLGLACAPIVETRFLELAMSFLVFLAWIPLGTFSILNVTAVSRLIFKYFWKREVRPSQRRVYWLQHCKYHLEYEKRLLLRCMHHSYSDFIYNMDHIRISGTELSSVTFNCNEWIAAWKNFNRHGDTTDTLLCFIQIMFFCRWRYNVEGAGSWPKDLTGFPVWCKYYIRMRCPVVKF